MKTHTSLYRVLAAALMLCAGMSFIAAEPPAASDAKPVPQKLQWGSGIKVLLWGGGSSHDFGRWFNLADKKLLEEGGLASVNYTEDQAVAEANLDDADVLVFSTNIAINKPELREKVTGFAKAGKGVVLVHAGVWAINRNWPEFHKDLVGGVTRSHDRYGEFEVKVTNTEHPVMRGVPATFTIRDELYHHVVDASLTGVEVLATAASAERNQTYPEVWTVKHPQARIVGITLGHDGFAHDHPAYKALLRNSVEWVKPNR